MTDRELIALASNLEHQARWIRKYKSCPTRSVLALSLADRRLDRDAKPESNKGVGTIVLTAGEKRYCKLEGIKECDFLKAKKERQP